MLLNYGWKLGLMLNKVSICVISAAGKGSRWAPVSGYLPKEMLPLVDRPVIEWVVDEIVSSGLKEIVVVINKQKQLIKKYLTNNERLRSKKINFYFVNQDEPLGITHAIYLTKKIIGKNDFTVALPDLPTISKKPVLGQLLKSYTQAEHIISFSNFSPDTLHFYSECLVEKQNDKLLRVIHFCPKSKDGLPHHKDIKIRMSGRYVFGNNIFSIIDKIASNKIDKEVNEVQALKLAIENGQKVVGVDISGHTYDTGTPAGYVRANTAFFKKYLAKKIDVI